MRHRVAGRKFGLPSDQRRALLKGLVRALLTHGEIETTETRAKDAKIIAEKVISNARNAAKDDVHSRRMARAYLNDEALVKLLFDTIAPKFASRPGGYTRLTKIGFRRGDAAPMVKLELVSD